MDRIMANPRLGCSIALILLVDSMIFIGMSPVHMPWLCLPVSAVCLPLGGSRAPDAPAANIWRDGSSLALTEKRGGSHSPPTESAEFIGMCYAWITPSSFGLVAPVVTTDEVRFSYHDDTGYSGSFTPAEVTELRQQYAKLLSTWKGGKYAGTDFIELVAQGGGHYERWSPLAIVHDAVFVLLLPIALSGLWVARKQHLRERHVAKGICSYCRYDVTGIASVCPECGKPIPRRAPEPIE